MHDASSRNIIHHDALSHVTSVFSGSFLFSRSRLPEEELFVLGVQKQKMQKNKEKRRQSRSPQYPRSLLCTINVSDVLNISYLFRFL